MGITDEPLGLSKARCLVAVVDGLIIPGSSMVEQEAVNFEVAGSSPAPGAMKKNGSPVRSLFFVV